TVGELLLLKYLAVGFLNGATAYRIDVNVPNAQSYHDQRDDENHFKYGYQVENISEQFQHKQQGPDDVTYGCYGHVDPVGGNHLTYFVADRRGYRPVLTARAVTVFPFSGPNDGSDDSQGTTIEWKDLPFPIACQSPSTAGSPASSTVADRGQRIGEPLVGSASRGEAGIRRGNEIATSGDGLEVPVEYQSFTDHDLAESQLSSNDHSVIYVQPNAGDDGQDYAETAASANYQTQSSSWSPFICKGDSLQLRPAVCEQQGHGSNPQQTPVTLYIPFRVLCSDIEEFQVQLQQLVNRFSQ
ncbi:uncharacterized protein LOC128278754, partial [Anopheles cruzii]|uniref:uncharacterized protein LOC128278754 n=1 Tax=Anopheles cruzii TaxID=68878 RepID=UPI0022EC3907